MKSRALCALTVRPYARPDEAAVVELWQRAGLVRPQNDPRADIERKLRVQPELFLVGELDGSVVASAMGGYDGHRGWLYYMAVAPELQGRGLGAQLLAAVEERLHALGCSKLNLQVRGDNRAALGFYERAGFSLEDRASLGKRLG